MKKEILDRLVRLQREYKSVYEEHPFGLVSTDYVQLREDDFNETFSESECVYGITIPELCLAERISYYEGVKFICFVRFEE